MLFRFVLAGYYGWVLWKSKHLNAEDLEAAFPAAAVMEGARSAAWPVLVT